MSDDGMADSGDAACRFASRVAVASGKDSPNMTERVFSSIPMRSRITRRVMRSQKDRFSVLSSEDTLWLSDTDCVAQIGRASCRERVF